MNGNDWDHAGATAGSLVLLGLGLLVLMPRASVEAASWAGMALILLAWLVLLYGVSWRP